MPETERDKNTAETENARLGYTEYEWVRGDSFGHIAFNIATERQSLSLLCVR